MIRDPSDGSVREKHKGPICKNCGLEFYYDFIPQPHLDSGYCINCFYEQPKTPLIDTSTSGLPMTKAKAEYLERLEESRKWLENYMCPTAERFG